MTVTRSIEVRLLGRFQVEIEDRDLTEELLRRRRAGDLLKLLAFDPEHRLARERVMDALWPNLSPDRAGANLRKAAHHLRSALGSASSIVLDGQSVRLGDGWVIDSDAGDFESRARAVVGHGDDESCREAASRYHGELLPGDYETWCVEPRRALRDLYLETLACGRLWGRLVEVDPTNEMAHQEIISAHLASGDRAAALRQFEHLRSALKDQLGVLPNARSMLMYEDALSLDGPDVPSPAERARALLAWGVVHWERQDVAEAERTARSARALAIDAGLGRELADASELLGLIAYAQGRWRDLFADEFLSSIRNTPELAPFLLDAHMCMSEFALGEADGLRQIDDLAETILDTATEIESDQGRALGLLLQGETILLGDSEPAEAIAPLEQARLLHEQVASTTGTVLALERLVQADDARGDHESALERHRRALQMAAESSVRRHLVPFVYGGMLAGRDGDDAFDLLGEAERNIEGLDLCPPCAMSYRINAVHACISVDDFELAADYLETAAEVAGMWQEGPWHSAVTEARSALVAGRNGSSDEVRRLLTSAAAGYASAGRPRDEARCREALAAIS